MLATAPRLAPSLTSLASPSAALPAASEDLLRACGTRKKPPAGGTGATVAAGPSGPAQGTAKTSKRGSAGKAKARPKPTSAAGYASAATPTSSRKTGSSTAKKAGPLAFLDDAKLSVEEKLLKLLAYLNDKWNKELDQKMKEFKQTKAAGASASSGGSGSSGGLGGVLKKAVSYASVAMPVLGVQLKALENPTVRSALRSVAGPALAAVATGFGQPELAPLALKYGPDVVDTLAGAAKSVSSGGTTRPGGTSGGSAKESAEGIGSGKDDQLKLMEMERIMSQQKEMFSLVSNMLRTTHDTRMAVIQNLR